LLRNISQEGEICLYCFSGENCLLAEREGGESAWCQFLGSREDPGPHVRCYSFGESNIPHAFVLEQLVELDVEASVGFHVVEGHEFFS
jgi:hypothetical protein